MAIENKNSFDLTAFTIDRNTSFVVKQSALQSEDIVGKIRTLFFDYDSVSIDYEGDTKYLSKNRLVEILEWLHSTFVGTKRLFYTIAVRSTYDILDQKATSYSYVQELLELYSIFENFQIILVAGNKKYVAEQNQKKHLQERFHGWIQKLSEYDRTKEIYLGADGMFKLTKNLLHTYENTQAILLKNPLYDDQFAYFTLELQSRVGVYALLITSKDEAVKSEYMRGYLKRRGIQETDYKEKIYFYAIEKEALKNSQVRKEFNFMFLFSVEE